MRSLIVLLVCLPTLVFAQTAEEWIESANKKMSEGNSLGAIKDFTAAIALDDTKVDAYYGRGSVYAELLMYDEALGDFNKALELDSTMALIYFNRGVVYNAKGYKSLALNDFSKYCDMRPNDPQGYLARAEYYA